MVLSKAGIHSLAFEAGFDRVGFAPAADADGFAHLTDWLGRGYAGDMAYLERQHEARRHPASILPTVQSVVMLAMRYHPGRAPSQSPVRVASYAQGDDYHDVLRERLNSLLDRLQQEDPTIGGRGVVDTAPLLERDFARRAGLGWVGKNTMLIDKKLGSWFFLAALLLDREFPADASFDVQHCGTCTRCLDACPTEAFVKPGVLDARKCISYLTIELRGPIPLPLRDGVGNWIFGCDICQEVCPWNRKATAGAELAFQPRAEWDVLDPLDILKLSDAEFRKRYRGTALFRTKRSGLVRNTAIAAANQGWMEALPMLEMLTRDEDPVVAEAAAWSAEKLRRAVV
ncbi:MAG: tRNA epoxyqueuosine(34) reductase QueG [Gemmataceae bacterium]|nr:tRNA epoxyqueuosine(34) reductase QueG [Gemmataceae bacterium]